MSYFITGYTNPEDEPLEIELNGCDEHDTYFDDYCSECFENLMIGLVLRSDDEIESKESFILDLFKQGLTEDEILKRI